MRIPERGVHQKQSLVVPHSLCKTFRSFCQEDITEASWGFDRCQIVKKCEKAVEDFFFFISFHLISKETILMTCMYKGYEKNGEKSFN